MPATNIQTSEKTHRMYIGITEIILKLPVSFTIKLVLLTQKQQSKFQLIKMLITKLYGLFLQPEHFPMYPKTNVYVLT